MELFCTKRLGLAFALSLIAVACAAPTIPNDGSGEDDNTSGESASTNKKPVKPGTTQTTNPTNPTPTPTPTPTPSPTPTPTPTPGGQPPPPAGDCAAAANGEACFQCCDQASGGELAKADDVFGACACDPGGQCATQCGANFCNGQQASAACEACLGACDTAADAACTSAACQAGNQCLTTSCAGKQ